MKRKIIIDCDPGHDDMLAIMVAVANPDKLDLLGVTTVSGNQTIEKVTRNALEIINFLGVDVPVHMGAVSPLVRTVDIGKGKEIHGETGLGGYVLPESKREVASFDAVSFMYKTIMSSKEKVTLVPTGPLTNIALLLKVHPDVVENIEMISLMGGSIYSGNVTPHAEFNVWADPEAAKVVFNSGLKIVVAALESTHKALLPMDTIKELMVSKKKMREIIGKLNYFHVQFFKDVWEMDGAPIHDACSVFYLLKPEMFTEVKYHIDVATDDLFRGKTFTDLRDWGKNEDSKTSVLMDVDGKVFLKELLTVIDYFEL